MSAPGIVFLVGTLGFSYMILALQLSSSFPPFYEKGSVEEEMWLDLPYMFGILALLPASVFFSHYLFVLFGLLSALIAFRVRQRVRKRTNGPLPWLLTPLTIGVFNRWPMLLFDVWTIGFAALMILIMLA